MSRGIWMGNRELLVLLLVLASLPVAGCKQSQESGVGGLKVSLVTDPNPPRVGQVTLKAKIAEERGAPVRDVKVRFAYFLLKDEKQQGLLETAEAKANQAGQYTASVKLDQAGQWKVMLTIFKDDERLEPVAFTLDVH